MTDTIKTETEKSLTEMGLLDIIIMMMSDMKSLSDKVNEAFEEVNSD